MMNLDVLREISAATMPRKYINTTQNSESTSRLLASNIFKLRSDASSPVNLRFSLRFDIKLPNDQLGASIWKIDHMEHSFRSLNVPSGESKRRLLLSYYHTNRNRNTCGCSLEYLNLGRFGDHLFEGFLHV